MFRSLFFINILQWKEWGPFEETAKSTSESGEKQDKPEVSCIGRTEGISHEKNGWSMSKTWGSQCENLLVVKIEIIWETEQIIIILSYTGNKELVALL